MELCGPRLIGEELEGKIGLPHTRTVARILAKVIFEPNVRLGCPCWLWQGRLNRNYYGRAWYLPDRKEIPCHRILWREMVGEIPKGLVLDHLCRKRNCCSPWHLEPITSRENTYRGNAILYRPKEAYVAISTTNIGNESGIGSCVGAGDRYLG